MSRTEKPAAPLEEMQPGDGEGALARNLEWTVLILPEDCHSIFVCMDGDLFDERIKNGIIPLLDDRKSDVASMPCFIGYAPVSSLTDPDILAGLRAAKPDAACPSDRLCQSHA